MLYQADCDVILHRGHAQSCVVCPDAQAAERISGAAQNFDVEVILGLEGMKTASPRFKVRWATFGEEDDTWEPYSMFEDDVFQYAWADEKLRAEAQKFARRWRK